MTGNTAQLMIDLADTLRRLSPEARASIHARLQRMSASVLAFAIGCSAAALFYAFRGVWCFVVPPLIALTALWVREPKPD